MRQILHVDQAKIRRNRDKGTNDPPIIIRDYKGVQHAHEAVLIVDGREVGRFIYRPHKPLDCGARLWLEVDTSICQIVPSEAKDESSDV